MDLLHKTVRSISKADFSQCFITAMKSKRVHCPIVELSGTYRKSHLMLIVPETVLQKPAAFLKLYETHL